MNLKKLENCRIIIWSLGDYEYVHEIFQTQFKPICFDFVFTREDSLRSLKKFGKYKHSWYLKEKFDSSEQDVFVAVDDRCKRNMDIGYKYRYQILPFKNDQEDNCLIEVLQFITEMMYFE